MQQECYTIKEGESMEPSVIVIWVLIFIYIIEKKAK